MAKDVIGDKKKMRRDAREISEAMQRKGLCAKFVWVGEKHNLTHL